MSASLVPMMNDPVQALKRLNEVKTSNGPQEPSISMSANDGMASAKSWSMLAFYFFTARSLAAFCLQFGDVLPKSQRRDSSIAALLAIVTLDDDPAAFLGLGNINYQEPDTNSFGGFVSHSNCFSFSASIMP